MEINVVKLKEYAEDCSVLYVEDDELIQSQTKIFLERFFPNITTADNGKEGLSKYEENEFDLVISDINMPEMNGIEMIKEINKIKEEQIILVTSAQNDSQSLIELINLGIMRFVLKPFNNKHFIIMLYYIVEDLHRKKVLLNEETLAGVDDKEALQEAKESKQIVENLKTPLVILDENEIVDCNKAYLQLYKVSTLEMLQRTKPNITMYFKSHESGLKALSNKNLIKALQTVSVSESRTQMEINNYMRSFQLELTHIQDERYILMFTDVTAFKDDLQRHRHTGIPIRQASLEFISGMKAADKEIKVGLFSLKNYPNVYKYNGKAGTIVADKNTSSLLQGLVKEHLPSSYLGYFGENEFIIIYNEKEDKKSFIKAFGEIKDTYNEVLNTAIEEEGLNYFLKLQMKELNIKTTKDMHEIELDILDGYDVLAT